ncbi:hypothetical protein SAMN05421688_2261 [Poseidonocella pacifica]|uniref:Glycosyltransferase 2-like domain-containing protein n=1 Tax=Poseidonocella pacifica TaxID=871651 RepID=A0A1I0XGX0_9RHOB|nr:TIGR04283 family arsenosugar biosynthesis glycosyltransferase [Poseidonocella pacifica]SFB00221.1 hypothetical protein SAMN05421688_2261 [Poseidonocella pacifica]
MRAPISVVIPTLNAGKTLPDCLASLAEGLTCGLIRDLIISDGGSTDETLEIAEAAGAQVVHGEASRGGQLQRGCAAAEGKWLLILHADSWLGAGWTEAAASHIQGTKAGYFRLRFRSAAAGAHVVAGWANLRARVFGIPYGDQGLLLPRTVYHQVGGFSDQPLMEDVALSRSLRGHLVPIAAEIRTGAERYEREGWMRRGAKNLTTLALYYAGVTPERLVARYERRR